VLPTSITIVFGDSVGEIVVNIFLIWATGVAITIKSACLISSSRLSETLSIIPVDTKGDKEVPPSL